MPNHHTDVILGDRYRDVNTGIRGVATAVHFYQHGCERVTIAFAHDGQVKTEGFDGPDLIHIASGRKVTARGTGGPRHTPHQRRTD